MKKKTVLAIVKHIKCILAKTQKTKNTLKLAISIDLFANFWYSIWAGKKSGAKVPFLPQEKPMERWSSGLRHTLGKRARLTASAGSNPVLSAKRYPTEPVKRFSWVLFYTFNLILTRYSFGFDLKT